MKKIFMSETRKHIQMSDALSVMAFLTVSGGFQDAYSYFVRGQVFANAQTGNIVLMSAHLFSGDMSGAVRYLIPLCAFALGVLAAEQIRARLRDARRLHWRQLIVLMEIGLLFAVGFFPHSLDSLANALVSFSCAMQVQTFRRVNGYAYASTMCIGNMRSGVESLSAYLRTGEPGLLRKAGHYFLVILLFALGAGIGSCLAARGIRVIWISSALLAVSFLLMFIDRE
jgi:uncharacterized membrane protein YoaK (UPF0700 family)